MIFGRFWTDRKAGVAPILAVSLIPILGVVGASVDYSRGSATHAAMQNALDAAGLMLSKQAQTIPADQLTTKAAGFFNALFQRPEATNVLVTPTLTQPQSGVYKLTMTGTADISTMFWRVLGTSEMKITATSEIVWGIRKLNIALALDNTGSMGQNNKLSELKTAAKTLLTTLQTAGKSPGDVKVAIIPFATDVNVSDAISESYIDWTSWDAANGTCSSQYYSSKSSCVSAGKIWTPASHTTWNGCVWDRDQNNDVNDTAAVAGTASTMFQAHQASGCPVKMMPLSEDWTALSAKIDSMTATGNTNVTIGLTWAWHTLSTNAPLNAPAAAPDLDKVVVLLTDGENTKNRWSSSTSSIDSRTEKACTNIKAANIRLYTVRVIDGNSTLLRNCATNPSMYYDVDQASELNGVFSSIAQSLATLRIVK